jgi:hypothetical protein
VPDEPESLDALLRNFYRGLLAYYRGALTPDVVSVRFRGGEKLSLPFPPDYPAEPPRRPSPPATPQAEGEELSDDELAVLDALDGEKLTGTQLARKAGLRHNAAFYRLLKRLRDLGLVVREPNNGPYHAAE